MFNFSWTHKLIETMTDVNDMRSTFISTTPLAGGFDTETTGLHIIKDSPFLFQFGWITTDMQGFTYVVDIQRNYDVAMTAITWWHFLAKQLPKYLAHNTTFDLHMLTNIGKPYTCDNISDLMIYIRLGTDAVAVKNGGAPMKLKDFAKRYIDLSAKDFEKELDTEKTTIAKVLNSKLRKRLGWTAKQVDTFFKDKLNEATDLPPDKLKAYEEWRTLDLPVYLQNITTGAVDKDNIRYDTLSRDVVIRYGHYDIVWLLEGYYKLSRAVQARKNESGIAQEEANIYPIYNMERVGLCIDVDYLETAKVRVKEYLRNRRIDLQELAGEEIKVGQHDKLKKIIKQNYGVDVESTADDELSLLCSDLKHTGENLALVEFIETVQELRTLEKWYSTYIMRFITTLHRYNLDRVYTQINQCGTVSGRVTSDFQQFPKDCIKTITGEELFHPRKMIKVDTASGFKGIVYLDYSQIELRLQAMYTILVGTPDTNLCRAYMPYKCKDAQGVLFDYNNREHIATAYTKEWFHEEDNTLWTPLDVHGATTKAAFGITEDDENFHKLRYVGKRVNFAKNYGAQYGKIKEMFPEFDDAQIRKIDGAYYEAFPGVKEYHNYCYAIAQHQAYAQNLFGVKYYNVSGHNLKNMLVQGTGAYFLKSKIVQVYNYLKENNCKSRLQMQIHDELSFEWHEEDDIQIFKDIQRIMETWEDTYVPIVADMEITYTNWAEKEEV